MNAMIKTVAAAALLASVAFGASAQTVDFTKIHQGAQVTGVCVSPLNQAQENKVGLLAAAATPEAMVGGVLSSETKVRGDARVQAYSLGCKDQKNVDAVKYYTDAVK